ncbi:MAG TPA: PhzF family phenazine biosynthesis protein [Mycobacteriales bacterium]|nr:PhzF family phenazine biosynthesis protein [Mycobacteriales bacterium]
MLELSNRSTVEAVTPDFAALSVLPYRGIIVTAAASPDEDFDFVSRFFAPNVGITEDPVTGSAHCALGPYWSARLGRDTLRGYQASARGGYVGVRLRGDRVELHGSAVTVMAGELTPEAEPEN